jgi:hypothetical protein
VHRQHLLCRIAATRAGILALSYFISYAYGKDPQRHCRDFGFHEFALSRRPAGVLRPQPPAKPRFSLTFG